MGWGQEGLPLLRAHLDALTHFLWPDFGMSRAPFLPPPAAAGRLCTEKEMWREQALFPPELGWGRSQSRTPYFHNHPGHLALSGPSMAAW